MPAVPRHFWVAILIQIGVEWNERLMEKIALDPDPRGVARRLLAETAETAGSVGCGALARRRSFQKRTWLSRDQAASTLLAAHPLDSEEEEMHT
jgi:hypothetical protein